MEGSTLSAAIVIRALQFFFSVIVLGISVSNYTQQKSTIQNYCGYNCYGGFYSAMGYAAFVGAFGLLDGVVGFATAFVSALPWIVMLVFEGLATLFYVAGAIRFTVLIKYFKWVPPQYVSDAAFLYLGFLSCLAALVFSMMVRRRNGGSLISVV